MLICRGRSPGSRVTASGPAFPGRTPVTPDGPSARRSQLRGQRRRRTGFPLSSAQPESRAQNLDGVTLPQALPKSRSTSSWAIHPPWRCSEDCKTGNHLILNLSTKKKRNEKIPYKALFVKNTKKKLLTKVKNKKSALNIKQIALTTLVFWNILVIFATSI